MSRRFGLPIALALVSLGIETACASKSAANAENAMTLPSATPGVFDDQEIAATATQLMEKIPGVQESKAAAMDRLRDALADATFRGTIGEVRGVIAYEGAQGGFMFTGGGGKGLVTFKGGAEAAPLQVGTAAVGAAIGGGKVWGVALVTGLTDQSKLSGVYKGTTRSATISAKSVNYACLERTELDGSVIKVYAFGASVGAAAGVSVTRVTIQTVK